MCKELDNYGNCTLCGMESGFHFPQLRGKKPKFHKGGILPKGVSLARLNNNCVMISGSLTGKTKGIKPNIILKDDLIDQALIGEYGEYGVSYGLPKIAELVEQIALVKNQEKWMKEFYEQSTLSK